MTRNVVALLSLGMWVVFIGAAVSEEQSSMGDERQEVQRIITELSPCSTLRKELQNGARGAGIHYHWMDAMRAQGVREALIYLRVDFKRNGRPKRIKFDRAEYFTHYDTEGKIDDPARLRSIRETGLEQELTSVASQKAEHGAWVDVPHPQPRPFDGGTVVKFFDNEWLPVVPTPAYCAGRYCLQSQSTLTLPCKQ